MDAGAGATPFLVVRPLEFPLHGCRHAPAVGEAELRQHCSSSGQAEVVNEILPQDPHGHSVEQKRALPRVTDYATLWVQLQKLLVIQVLDAHRPPHQIEGIVLHFDWIYKHANNGGSATAWNYGNSIYGSDLALQRAWNDSNLIRIIPIPEVATPHSSEEIGETE
ncbi:MAG: hypothetical protein P8X82_18180 [Gemmatimonadales bacterium]